MSLPAVEFTQTFDVHVSHSVAVVWVNEGYIRHLVCVSVCACVCVFVWLGPVCGASLLWEECWCVNMKRVWESLHVYMCHVCWQLTKTVSDHWTGSKPVSLDRRVHFSFEIHTWSHTYTFSHTYSITPRLSHRRPRWVRSYAELQSTHTPFKVWFTGKCKILSSVLSIQICVIFFFFFLWEDF